MDMITLAAAKKYTEDSLKGAGALKGQDGRGINNIYVYSQTIPIEGGDTDVTLAINYTDHTTDYIRFMVPAGKGGVLTDEDKAQLVNKVLDALPTWEGGAY